MADDENTPPAGTSHYRHAAAPPRLPLTHLQQALGPMPKHIPATVTAEDRRGTEAARASFDSAASKLSALRAFRRARGLCFKCGEHWGKDHTCLASVQLHIADELWALFSQEDLLGSRNDNTQLSDEEKLCTLSQHAMDGSPASIAIQLHAYIQGHEVSVLIDSGSSTSFVDLQLSKKLSGVQDLPNPCRVKIADGALLPYTHFIPACSWMSQGHKFEIDFRILSLGAYDAILGIDWMRKHSPMNVDWVKQHLDITTPHGRVNLQGIASNELHCSAISAQELLQSCKQGVVAHMVHLSVMSDNLVGETPIPVAVLCLLK